MIAVVFKKEDNMPVFIGANNGEETLLVPDIAYIENAISINGGVAEDYIVGRTNDKSTIERIFQGDSFSCAKTNDIVTGFDFSIEDSKMWVEITTDSANNRQRLYLDGHSDELYISAQIFEADKTTVNLNFNETISFYCIAPSGKRIPTDAEFSNGQHSERFYPTEFGVYKIPSGKYRCSNGEIRVVKQLEIEVYYKA